MGAVEFIGQPFFCIAALEQALEKDTPEIFNTDQGSQFTSDVFAGVLLDKKIALNMDGRGRAIDSVFIERLWRTLKHEDVYPKVYSDGHSALPWAGCLF